MSHSENFEIREKKIRDIELTAYNAGDFNLQKRCSCLRRKCYSHCVKRETYEYEKRRAEMFLEYELSEQKRKVKFMSAIAIVIMVIVVLLFLERKE